MKAFKTLQYLLLLGGVLFVISACEDEAPVNYAPTVTTGSATSIYRKGAFLAGGIESSNGAKIKEFGIMLSEFESMVEPLKFPASQNNNPMTFRVETNALTPNNTYYYQAYASSGASIVKGEVKSFITPETNAPIFSDVVLSDLGAQSVTVSSLIQDDGGSEILIHGFCWKEMNGNSNSPTVADNIVNVEIGPQRITAVIGGLAPENEYLICPYGINAAGLGYGETVRISTLSASVPVISNFHAVDSTEVSYSLHATIGSRDAVNLKRFGFCWSESNTHPTVDNSVYCELTELSLGLDIQYTIENLKSQTTYYIRAYAENETGIGYSEVLTHITPKHMSLNNKEVAEITSHSAFLQTIVDCDAETVPKRVGYMISFEDNCDLTLETAKNILDATSTWDGGKFSIKVEDLNCDTQYFVRAFFEKSSGSVFYGELQSFRTGLQGIYNKEDLMEFRDASYLDQADMSHWMNVKKEINLYADIDLDEELWAPIWEITDGIIFNGNNHIISGLYIDGSVKEYGNWEFDNSNSFIRSNSGTVKNLIVEGKIVINDTHPGSASGIVAINEGLIVDCTSAVDMDVTLNNSNMAYSYAGISHSLYSGSIVKGCVNKGYIMLRGDNNGADVNGIANANYSDSDFWYSNAIIENCTNYGDLTVSITNGNSRERVAGIGMAPTISNCVNYGKISSTYDAGGIALGLNCSYAVVNGCKNYGEIKGGVGLTNVSLQIYTGGIASSCFSGTLINCINEGNVSGEDILTGGIVGYLSNQIKEYSNNTNRGSVNGQSGTENNAIGLDCRNFLNEN